MLCSNCGMCSNWNAQVAAVETKNGISLRMKTELFTDLWYFFPLVKGSVRVLAASKARTGPQNMHAAVQSLGTDHNENMTYDSILRYFAVLISTFNIWMLLSEILLLVRLNGREYEHHSQYRHIAEVYQCTIYKYTITVYNSTLLFLLHIVTYNHKNFHCKIFM